MAEVKSAISDEDVELLRAVAECGSLAAAGEELGLALQSVKNRLSRIYATLGVKGGPQAVYAVFVLGRRTARP